jgi:Reversibly glycosylated polypeptide
MTVEAKRVAVVVTTIGDGAFVDAMRPLFEIAGGRLTVIVIGDRKSPPACGAAVARLSADGHDAIWMDEAAQRAWLANVPDLASHIPWNSDNRRNVGVLEAWRRGADVIVSLDDDNMPIDAVDFFAHYSRVGGVLCAPEVQTGNRWVNVCELIECRSGYDDARVSVFARGFPLARRVPERLVISPAPIDACIALHLGLWLGEPDVDAATRASVAPRAVAARVDSPVILPVQALAPFSTQNLAAARRLVPAWWFVRMGDGCAGLRMDRFGDMFQGYFAAMAIAAMGERIAVGPPLVEHGRNVHALGQDLAVELPGMLLLDSMLSFLETPLAPADSYASAYLSIASGLTDWARTAAAPLWRNALPAWADSTAETMRAWVDACRVLDTAAIV